LKYFFLRHATYCSEFFQHACGLHEATQQNVSLLDIRFVSGKVNERARWEVSFCSLALFTTTVLRFFATDMVIIPPNTLASRGMCFREEGRDDLPIVMVGWDCRQSEESQAV
jgi:hypothetical protein